MFLSSDAQNLVLQAHLISTLFMTGLIWFVQVVHYPLLKRVGKEAFSTYARKHQHLTGWLVGPVMLVEVFSGMLLFFSSWVGRYGGYFWTNMFLLFMIWLATYFFMVPLHRRLTKEYRAEWVNRLVQLNWIRTVAWTVRAALLIGFLGG